jgi:hypothetical protein
MDMEEHRVKRPLLWLYNPYLVGLYAALPSVGRVLHATENYFHFDGLPESFLNRHKVAIQISDVVVAVSEGVATSIRENVADARVTVVSNGCDYKEYSRFVPNQELLAIRSASQRIVIYAGNINNRLDYVLIQRCVMELRDVLFAFFGPVAWLSGDDARRWTALIHEPNVRYFGAAPADMLAGLYGAADVGVIPYKQTRVLVENGFPLKALEMCATGLPVVSTFMKPIEGLMDGLVVARDHDSFVGTLARTSRSSLSARQLDEMRRVCQQQDYDLKFGTVLDLMERSIGNQREPDTRWDAVVARLLMSQWVQCGGREWRVSLSIAGSLRTVPAQVTNRLAHVRMDRGVLGRLGRAPQSAVAKGILMLRLVMADRMLRRLLWEYVRDRQIQRQVGLADVLADLLRLGILRWHRMTPITSEFRVNVQYEPAEGRLLLVSAMKHPGQGSQSSMEESPVRKVDSLKQIVWDHSAVAHSVLWTGRRGEQLSVYLGPDGVYEFVAIEALTRRHEEVVGRAVIAAVLAEDSS